MLHPDYILASHKAGQWLAEESYEWSPALSSLVSQDLRKFLKAPRRQRERMKAKKHGPFLGWSVAVIVSNPQKKIVYNR